MTEGMFSTQTVHEIISNAHQFEYIWIAQVKAGVEKGTFFF